MGEKHKHTCKDCGLIWFHSLDGCLISEEKGENYPCKECMRNHIIIFNYNKRSLVDEE